jgi:SAM-dependent methyltransferase
MKRWELLNRLADHVRATRYVEIGVQGGECFRNVRVPIWKAGVDPDPSSAATCHATSDAYYAALDAACASGATSRATESADLVFVDGLHHAAQVSRDVANALRYLRHPGAVVLHDVNPPTEQAAAVPKGRGAIWCGDVWKAWLDLRATLLDRDLFVVDTDLGCGVVLPLLPGAARRDPFVVPAESRTWAGFEANRREWLRLLSVEDFLRLLDEREESLVRTPWKLQ